MCSATTIRPNVVITAGHCVHEGNGGNWYTNFVYVPAYNKGTQPYGNARGIRPAAFRGWTRDGSFNHDIGLIKLDRNIGTTTGWHAIGSRSNPGFYVSAPASDSFILGVNMNNFSYPAESPYNGQRMYYRFGSFDGWYALMLQAYFNKTTWKGQSGSSYYYRSVSSRVVYAITSNRTSTRTGATIINRNKLDLIIGWISAVETGFDLTPLFVAVDSEGDATRKLSYLVNNNSGETWSGIVSVDVYLSDNANISAADTLIQQHEFEASFGPLSSVEVHVPSITIPEGTPAGKYYVGVVLDFADANPDNNDSDGQDVGEITVNP